MSEPSSPGREGVGILSEAEEGPSEAARRRCRKPSWDGGDFTVGQQDSCDSQVPHTIGESHNCLIVCFKDVLRILRREG